MNTLEGGGGILRNWSLFSRPENTKYFDMAMYACSTGMESYRGRIYVILYAMLIWQCYKKEKLYGLHDGTQFCAVHHAGSAFYLRISGEKLCSLFDRGILERHAALQETEATAGGEPPAEGEIQEEYWWQGWRFFMKQSGR